MKNILFILSLFILGCEDPYLEVGNITEEIVENEVATNNSLNVDMVAMYSFDGNSNDSSPNQLHGVLYEGGYTNCRNNNENSSLQLDINDSPSWGEENDRVEIPYDPIMDVDNITISAWVNLNEKVGEYSDRNYSIASRWSTVLYGTPEEEASYAFYINNSFQIEFAGNSNEQGGLKLITSDEEISFNEWNHVVVTINDTHIQLYLNGNLIKENEVVDDLLFPHTDIDLFLGERKQFNGYWYHFDGKLDDIGIWGRALTPCEITTLYNM